MKRIIAAVLTACLLLLALSGCKKKYAPVESTAQEARVVMTLSIGGRSYEVKYELYRALFLTYKSEIDGGKSEVWQGDESHSYIKAINERITERLCEIYAVLYVSQNAGFDLYSDEVEDEIYNMIKVSVEGGEWGDSYYEGFGGNYNEYLASLKEMYHNYSTAVLLMRYEIAYALIEKYYIGESSIAYTNGRITDGALVYDREDIQEFYYSDKVAQVLHTYIPEEIDYAPKERAESVRREAVEAARHGDEAVKILMINSGTPSATSELEKGLLISEHSLSSDYTSLARAAIALGPKEVSEVIETNSAKDGRRYYVLYKTEKSDDYFNANYVSVVEVYLYDAIGALLGAVEEQLANSATFTEEYENIIHSEIKI